MAGTVLTEVRGAPLGEDDADKAGCTANADNACISKEL